MSPSQTARIDSVQLLRGVAATAVVATHIPLLENGAWGVDLFFVISGFIMCYVTAASSRYFFTKRLIRIVPLYWAGTIGVFLIALMVPQLLKNTRPDAWDLVRSLLFIPFQKGQAVQPVLFLGWTLNYEMFFYVLFAVSTRICRAHRSLICSMLLIAIVSAGRVAQPESVVLQFYSDGIVIEYAFGMACYELYIRSRSGYHLAWIIAGIVLLLCMPFIALIAPAASRELRWGTLAAAVLFCTVMGTAGLKLPRIVVLLGDASYSLYLFHPYIIQAFTRLKTFNEATLKGYSLVVAAILLCYLLALVCYHLFERPISIKLKKRLLSRERRITKQEVSPSAI